MANKWTTLEESWEILDQLADPYVGIVRREYRKLRDVDDIWGHSYGRMVQTAIFYLGYRLIHIMGRIC